MKTKRKNGEEGKKTRQLKQTDISRSEYEYELTHFLTEDH